MFFSIRKWFLICSKLSTDKVPSKLTNSLRKVEKQPSICLFRDRFATPHVNRKEGEGEEGGVERSGRRAENKKRAKWSAGPVVSCDRKWHSFFASLPLSSTKPRRASTRSPSSSSSRRVLLLIPSSTLQRTQQQRKIALS